MAAKSYTIEQKKDKVTAWAEKVAATDAGITYICDELEVCPDSIRKWASKDAGLKKIYSRALIKRAWRYADTAKKILEDAQCFYVDEKTGRKKECSSPLNKAKHRADFLMRLASIIAPSVFSDYRHEIKAIQKELSELKAMLHIKKIDK
ncbi:hypothetical protein KY315_00750 [Candidatus Woesearchaeota archaeon]|nr:hypothetical protein [Candidatus Woesearchaeota archaeon]